MRKLWWAAAVVAGAGVVALAGTWGWSAWRAEWARRNPEAARTARYEQVFDIAWKTVDEKYYDPNFDHERWRKIRDVYRPHVRDARNDAEFYINLLMHMMNQVGTSHVGVTMPVPVISPVPAGPGRPSHPRKLAGCGGQFVTGDPGFETADVRRGHSTVMLVSDVRRGSNAERAGVAPNDLIRELTIAWRKDACPQVELKLQTEGQAPRALAFSAEDRPRSMPVQRIDLPSGVRVLRFDRFDRDSEAWLAQNLAPAPRTGLVLDLRRNGGGKIWVETKVLGRFLPPGTVVGRQVKGGKTTDEVTKRVEAVDDARLAVLIGPASASAAETTAAALRHYHRAVLVGGQTSGQVLASRNFRLPDGGGVQVAVADYLTPDGRRLEGVGVEPDIPVVQTLEAIRLGRDLPLEAAERALLAGR